MRYHVKHQQKASFLPSVLIFSPSCEQRHYILYPHSSDSISIVWLLFNIPFPLHGRGARRSPLCLISLPFVFHFACRIILKQPLETAKSHKQYIKSFSALVPPHSLTTEWEMSFDVPELYLKFTRVGNYRSVRCGFELLLFALAVRSHSGLYHHPFLYCWHLADLRINANYGTVEVDLRLCHIRACPLQLRASFSHTPARCK